MSRSTLSQGNRLNRGPRHFADAVPALSVMAASLLAILPIISPTGWWPDFGMLTLVAWRLLRADAWPAWWAAPLGLFNDLMAGNAIGLSVALWSALMIVMDLVDRRTQWRDYWIEWAVAAVLIALFELAQWQVAALNGAPLPFIRSAGPSIILSILTFPVVSWLVARLDWWRLRP